MFGSLPSSIQRCTRRGSMPSKPRMTSFCLNVSGAPPPLHATAAPRQTMSHERISGFTTVCGARNYNIWVMRVLGVDVGARRVGLAISDATRTLARPLATITVAGDADAIDRVAAQIATLSAEDDGLAAIVVGLPAHLDGTPSDATARVRAFVASLRARTALPIATEDERLSSREAESRLALREKDWRRRKDKLDAAAAAIILQDYLDRTR